MPRTTIVGLGWREQYAGEGDARVRRAAQPFNWRLHDRASNWRAAPPVRSTPRFVRPAARDLPHELRRRKRKRNMHDRVPRQAGFGGDRRAGPQSSRPQSRLIRQGCAWAGDLSDPPNGILQTVAASEAVFKSVG